MLPISVTYLCRNSKIRANFSLYLERFMMESWLLPSSQIVGTMYNTVVLIRCMMWKMCRSPTLYSYLKTVIKCKWHKQGSLSSLRPLTGWGLQLFDWKSQWEKLKRRPNTVKPPLFSLVNTFNVLNLNKVMLRDKKSVSTTVNKKTIKYLCFILA
jgi:hypothetical protein